MVRVEVLNEALRGGDSAQALAKRTAKRLDAADRALREAFRDAPSYLKESKSRHAALCESSAALNTELDMLTESLEEITLKSQNVVSDARANVAKAALLDQLALALPPYVQVAEALHVSDTLDSQTFLALQATLIKLRSAHMAALASNRALLLRVADDIEERETETTAMMNARFMDLFQMRPTSVSARYLPGTPRPAVGVASDVLAKTGLLPHAIKSIVAEILRNDIARGLRAATVFFSADLKEGRALEWTIGDGNDSELLEFDLDDLDNASDADIDAMSDALDIANAAARAVKIFDLLRDVVLGAEHAAPLALALQPWFVEQILPASGVVLSERRAFQGMGVPKETLRVRAHATAASARIVTQALRARGAPDFQLILDTDALERTVGAECRAEALLAARRAISTFADADHDASHIVRCPLSSPAFVPREHRRHDYFPSCLVSQSAAAVLAIFNATRGDALDARSGGSAGIAGALDAAALELLKAYVADVPLQHGDELHASLRLKALYYNDCMTLAHASRLSLASERNVGGVVSNAHAELEAVAAALERAAQTAMLRIRKSAEDGLSASLDSACANGALGAYGTLLRLQRASSLAGAQSELRRVISVLSDIVATEMAELAAATLCDRYLARLCDEVLALAEISAEGCEQIDGILADADACVGRLMRMVEFMVKARQGAPAPPPVERLGLTRRRVAAYREVLNGRMEGLVVAFRQGRYAGVIERNAMEHFLVAIFEDTPLRARFITELDIGARVEEDSEEWSNTNW